MSAGTEQRKLAAIMFTDMVGYSALAQRNEALALQLLEEHRSLLRSLFPRFNGREVKTIGDAFLVEFHSALEAAQCAIEIQRTLAKRNHDVAAPRRIEVRIGIHIGDVVQRADGDVLGDGVNIASRIEPLAGANGICISVDVERQIRNTIEASLVKLGPTELKNIQVPMELFRIVLPWEKAGASSVERRASEGGRRRLRPLVVAVILLVMGLGWWALNKRGGWRGSQAGEFHIASLAVKPLDDFSGDTSQAYLSDGMTEALCSSLGNVSGLQVRGRASVMRYKNSAKSIKEMARELEVDAIVEGSIQRAGNQVLITVQLIEAGTDRHLWATNYKRDLSDFFKVQNEVAQAIAQEVKVRLTPQDRAQLTKSYSAKPEAVEAYLMGRHHWFQFSPEGSSNALRYFHRAIEIDPNYAPAHAGLALAYGVASARFGLRPREGMPKSKAAAEKAIELDPLLSESYVARGMARALFDWDWVDGEKDLKQALELSPNSTLVADAYAHFLTIRGRFDEAIALLNKALEHDPLSPNVNSGLGWTYYMSGQPGRAIPPLRKALELDRNFLHAHLLLGLCYQLAGQPGALTELQTGLQLAPGSALAQCFLGYVYGQTGRPAEAMKVLADLDQLASKGFVSPIAQAFVYLGLGQKDLALDWLEKAYDEHVAEMSLLRVDLALAPLRNEPRFQALIKKMGLDK